MKNKAKIIDTTKNVAIVFLFVSAVFLLYKIVSTQQGSSLNASPSQETVEVPNSEYDTQFSFPVFLLVTGEEGSHYAVKYDNQSRNKLVSEFSAYLGEALGSAGTLTEISTKEWEAALGGSGVFFDYLYPQPLSAIASCLGTSANGEAADKSSRRFFLGNSSEKLVLYFISADENKIYKAETASGYSRISQKIAECPLGDAEFAFELEEEPDNLDPYFILSNESLELQSVAVSNPVRDAGFDSVELLGYFGMNSRTNNSFNDADGSTIYVDSQKNLRIEALGRLFYSSSDGSGVVMPTLDGELEIVDCISECYKIAESTVGASSGDAILGIVDIEGASSPSSCTISFGYYLNGIPVTLSGGGYAASFRISNGVIVEADLYFRNYSFSGSTFAALPEKQAVALAETKGGEPVLTYEDKLDYVDSTWVRITDDFDWS